MTIFSERTLSALYAAGWTPNRNIDISTELDILKKQGYSTFPAALDFMKRFSGLQISFQSLFDSKIHYSVHFGTKPVLYMEGEGGGEGIEGFAEDLNTRLCPIGADNSGILWTMAEDGKVYGIYMPVILLMGNSGEQAIENTINYLPSNPLPVVKDYTDEFDAFRRDHPSLY